MMEIPLKDVEYDAYQRVYKEMNELRAKLTELEERYFEIHDILWHMKHPEEASDAR